MTDPSASTVKTQRRHPIRNAVAVLILLLAVGVAFDQKTQPKLISGPLVQIPKPDALAFVWNMNAYFARGAVRLTLPDGSSITQTAKKDGTRYEVTFDGLTPGTSYAYTVLNKGLLWRPITLAGPFKTATAATRGTPFRFLVFGDSGNGSNGQAALAAIMADRHPALVIHTGDLVYPDGAIEDYLMNFWVPNTTMIRSTPFMPTLGNHDYVAEKGQAFVDTFVLPINGPRDIPPERSYWFDYGDARFVALDSNLMQNKQSGLLTPERMKEDLAPWVRDALSDCDARWKFVYFHHPLYTGSEHLPTEAAPLKDACLEIFERFGVDMVFVGHNHLYERTTPLLRDQMVGRGEGIVYITTGAGGARLYPERLPSPPYIVTYNDHRHSFTEVDLTADRLELRQIDDRRVVIDEYSIEKSAARTAAR